MAHEFAPVRGPALGADTYLDSATISSQDRRRRERNALEALLRFYGMARLLMAPNRDLVDFLGQRIAKPTILMPHGVDSVLFSPERRYRKDHAFTLGYVPINTREEPTFPGRDRTAAPRLRTARFSFGNRWRWQRADLA